MANGCMLVVFILSLLLSTVLCQTFQYSRGWTNGKRSVPELSSSMEMSEPSSDVLTSNEMKILRMLLHENIDKRPLLIHCDVVDKLRKIVHNDNFASQMRRENGDNY